jgi:asparagine N-glycosylation enzyme membrane subunit Stt3
MEVSIGVPQAILLALWFASLVLNCVNDGKESVTHWWAVVAALAIQLALLAWGGFFS